MDSPELQYLKAMHRVNQKFYAYATLEIATTQAMIAALTEMVKGYIITERNYDPDGFRDEYHKKLQELNTGFQTAARDFLSRSDLEPESESE
jgi:hypothetical protein